MEKLQIAFQAWSDNIRQKKEQEEKRIAEEQVAKARYWKIPICNDDDEDDTIAITPVLPTEKPDNSLSMGDEHLSTISKTESDELIKSIDENLFPIPSESEDFSDIESDLDDSIPPGIESDDYDSEGDNNSTSFPEFESFHDDYPDLGDSTIDVVEYIPVDVPNILPTHPTLHMDFNFIPSHNDFRSDLDVSSPSRDRNKIYDPGICIEVESTRFLATHSPVIDTLLPFSSKNKDKVFNHGVLASKENFLFFITSGLYASGFFIMKARIGLIHGP
ncbi:hypothetical protein Tco_1327533 [Tanacetum coccineum]